MGDTRVIKRYANRKLYDTTHSRYVTLDQIGELVRAGEEVKIVDNTTKEDLTSVTLAQIIFEEEKRKKSFLPLGTLKSILQSGGEQLQELARSLKVGAAEKIKSIRSKDASKEESPEPLEERKNPEEKNFIQNVIDGSQRTFDELQRRVDERVKTTLHTLTLPISALQREFSELSGRLERLERRIAELAESRANRHESKTENGISK
jgi:polyhydroxyalkanoate synthesis repressor PhaR